MKQVFGNLVSKVVELTKDSAIPNGASREKTGSFSNAGRMMSYNGSQSNEYTKAVLEFAAGCFDAFKIAEQEKTNRTEITARRDIALESIRAQRDAFSELMKYTFKERSVVLAKQFEALDFALANGNIEVVQSSLNAMVAVIQTSPFKNMQEMQTALGSKDFVVRLE